MLKNCSPFDFQDWIYSFVETLRTRLNVDQRIPFSAHRFSSMGEEALASIHIIDPLLKAKLIVSLLANEMIRIEYGHMGYETDELEEAFDFISAQYFPMVKERCVECRRIKDELFSLIDEDNRTSLIKDSFNRVFNCNCLLK